MRIFIWNVRGLGKPARRGQLRDYILKERIDIIGLQETTKIDFSRKDLAELAGDQNFIWNWLPVKENLGGFSLGLRLICWNYRIVQSDISA